MFTSLAWPSFDSSVYRRLRLLSDNGYHTLTIDGKASAIWRRLNIT